MSQASATSQIVFTRKSGVYMPRLVCDKGDLFQEYDDTGIFPNFVTTKPTLTLIITSSRSAEGNVIPSAVAWYFNGTLLTFVNGISTNVFNGETGHFKKIDYAAGVNDGHGLQIIKDIVTASGSAACAIKCVATVSVGSTSDTIQCICNIPISRGTGNSKHVTIQSGDNKYFTIREKGGSCILKAYACIGSVELTANITYKWFKMVSGAWVQQSGTASTLTVNESDVDTTGMFKLEVYQDSNFIGQDTQVVMDLSDPLDIILNPVPTDETIQEGNTTDKVTYTPILVKRGGTTKYKDCLFYFTFTDNAGNILNPSTNTTAAASGICTYAMCVQADGNVQLTIETSI